MSVAKEPPVVPIVHMNGTSKAELIRLRDDAYAALNFAYRVLKLMAPNGRDYYPEPGKLELAIAQHTKRLQSVADLQASIETEMEAIDQQ